MSSQPFSSMYCRKTSFALERIKSPSKEAAMDIRASRLITSMKPSLRKLVGEVFASPFISKIFTEDWELFWK